MPEIEVHDRPRGQGRHRTGRGREYTPTSTLEARHWIKEAWREAGFSMVRGPVRVDVTAVFARPKGHYGTGRNAERLKPAAPRWPTTRTSFDRDNLDKLVLDALTEAKAIEDDSYVVDGRVRKMYARSVGRYALPGWVIGVWPIEEDGDG